MKRKLTLGIRQRVLIITLLPLCMITLILGGYFINTRLDDARDSLIEKGQTMTRMMSTSAEFGLLIGNKEILQGLIRSATKAEEVDDVIFLSPAFDVIVQGKPNAHPVDKDAGYPLYKNNQVYFLNPVVATGVDFLDSDDTSGKEAEPEFIGWVVIVLSERPTQVRQFEILTKGVILAIIGLLTTLLIASRFGQRITNPILGLTHVIEMLQHGQLETRASLSSTGELRSLAQGINRLAQRVQESNQTLESRVDKATKRLRSTLVHLEKQNQALDKARKRADKANVAKDEFLARMSHELRTPLTSVSGFARLLDQTELQVEQQEYTRIINLTSDLLLSIIDDILDYSKLESNAIELEEISFEFESCVIDVMEMQAASANEKGIELIPIIEAETPKFIIGDPTRLRQILSNLISNAVKFTSAGYVCLHVSTRRKGLVETELEIVIRDTGVGIPKERITNLFQAFSQADTSITRKFGGSGLGLVIAKRLTELMGGSISLASEENQGTEVTLKIPFSARQSQRVQHTYESRNIILFDANPLCRAGLKHQFDSIQTKIIEASSYSELLTFSTELPESTIVWGLPPKFTQKNTIEQINQIIERSNGRLILLSSTPVSIINNYRVVQLRKPARTQLLLNALSPDSYKLPEYETANALLIFNTPTILIAEDNDFNRLLVRKILVQAGAKVLEARTGSEALQQTLKHQPDLVLMDVHMPEMDGIEATKQIRLTQPTLPIIALTANVIASEHQKLIESGISHVLLKPINDGDLCHSINQFLSFAKNDEPLKPAQQNQVTDIEKYDLGKQELSEEVRKQLLGMMNGFESKDIAMMRNHSHQLLGLAGLFQIPELEVSGNKLHDALIKQEYKTIWKELWQLKRIIENEQYDLSEEL
ncbi:ATP-binding protein [Neptuniibacter sp. QD29_5]|uniref:ATP-binding protein n=1 Tax=Neptuniibacter sp. QD29_5 TaxID=3398207 RepID=UPI0039F56AC0